MSSRLELSDLTAVGWGGVAFLATMVLVIRPISVWLCTTPSALTTKEKIFLSGMAPRGIVAAAITSVFALRLGEEHARVLVPLVFFVILGTVSLYGLGGARLAYRLGLASPQPQGILFLGAHRWARAIAEELHKLGVPVLLADTNANNIRAARMAGLRTFLGSPATDSADERIDLSGIGRIVALTSNDAVNNLAATHYQPLFGRAEVYQLAGDHGASRELPESFKEIAQRFREGQEAGATPLTDQFDLEAWRAEHGEHALPLIQVGDDGTVKIATTDKPLDGAPGSTLLGIR